MSFYQLSIHIIIYHMPPQPGLPNSKETWKRALEASEKSERRRNTSASKIEEWQFLKLRVLWRIPRVPGRAILRLFENEGGRPLGIFQNELEHAREELSCVRSWKAYIKHLEERPQRGGSSELLEDLGVFALVVKHQQEVDRLKNKDESEIEEDVGEGLRFFLRPRKKAAAHQEELFTPAWQTPTPNNKNTTTPTTPTLLANNLASLSISDSPFAAYSPIARNDGVLISELYPRALDEQIVNTALIDFLQAITIHLPYAAQWTLHRKAFKLDDWEARVDGYLQQTKTRQVKAIVEAKACIRDTAVSVSRIRMQEGAQMAAWIFADADEEGCRKGVDGRRRRVLISQDRHQIFVTFAMYDAAYINYLRGGAKESNPNVPEMQKESKIAKQRKGKVKKDKLRTKVESENYSGETRQDNEEDFSFLEMHEFGPFETRDSNNMRHLGSLILAIVSQICA